MGRRAGGGGSKGPMIYRNGVAYNIAEGAATPVVFDAELLLRAAGLLLRLHPPRY